MGLSVRYILRENYFISQMFIVLLELSSPAFVYGGWLTSEHIYEFRVEIFQVAQEHAAYLGQLEGHTVRGETL